MSIRSQNGLLLSFMEQVSRSDGHVGHSTNTVSDVSQWETWLNPLPGDLGVAHEEQ